MIAFDVRQNGKRVVRAGIPDAPVLSAFLIYRQARGEKPRLTFSVSGMARATKGELDTHIEWNAVKVKVGDRIRIRVVRTEKVDAADNHWKPEGKPANRKQKLAGALWFCRLRSKEVARQIKTVERALKALRRPVS